MTHNTGIVNFTYNSPNEDFEQASGFRSNGSIDVKYTLQGMKTKLQENINLINKLLEHAENITELEVTGYNRIEITSLNDNTLNQLIQASAVRLETNNISESESESDTDDNEIIIEEDSDKETHSNRFNRLKRLADQNDVGMIFENSDDDSSDESDEDNIIDDPKNTKYIIDKYKQLAENDVLQEQRGEDTESENDSD